MNQLVIWGMGGHSKVVVDAARAAGYREILHVDDAADHHWNVRTPELLDMSANRRDFVVAIGCNRDRRSCFQRGLALGWHPATVVHPAAVVSPTAVIGRGSVVLARAVINAGAQVGTNCIVNTGAIVEHDCTIADHAHLSPGCVLGGGAAVGEESHIGLGAILLPLCRVGRSCTVGAGAVVLADVASRTTVVGIPARVLHAVATPVPL